jgi:hypothetical protein
MPLDEKWKPWEDSKQEAPVAINKHNSMKGPPCLLCKFWKPQVKFLHTEKGYLYDGVRCCHAEEMQPDFSCFRDGEHK